MSALRTAARSEHEHVLERLGALTSSLLELVVLVFAVPSLEEARMTTIPTASEHIAEHVTGWPGVEVAGPGKRGELVFKLGRKELGYLRGDHVLHIDFPKVVWHELVHASASSAWSSGRVP